MNSIIEHTLKKLRAATGKTARLAGYAAEDRAATWLQHAGLQIVARNVRYTFGEIDIVAWHGNVLVLFEVRLRSNPRFGDAAASITPRKQARLWAAGQAYAAQFAKPPPMRIDVLAFSDGAQTPIWIQNALG